MTVTNVFLTSDPKERKLKQQKLCRRCALLLQSRKAGRDAV